MFLFQTGGPLLSPGREQDESRWADKARLFLTSTNLVQMLQAGQAEHFELHRPLGPHVPMEEQKKAFEAACRKLNLRVEINGDLLSIRRPDYAPPTPVEGSGVDVKSHAPDGATTQTVKIEVSGKLQSLRSIDAAEEALMKNIQEWSGALQTEDLAPLAAEVRQRMDELRSKVQNGTLASGTVIELEYSYSKPSEAHHGEWVESERVEGPGAGTPAAVVQPPSATVQLAEREMLKSRPLQSGLAPGRAVAQLLESVSGQKEGTWNMVRTLIEERKISYFKPNGETGVLTMANAGSMQAGTVFGVAEAEVRRVSGQGIANMPRPQAQTIAPGELTIQATGSVVKGKGSLLYEYDEKGKLSAVSLQTGANSRRAVNTAVKEQQTLLFAQSCQKTGLEENQIRLLTERFRLAWKTTRRKRGETLEDFSGRVMAKTLAQSEREGRGRPKTGLGVSQKIEIANQFINSWKKLEAGNGVGEGLKNFTIRTYRPGKQRTEVQDVYPGTQKYVQNNSNAPMGGIREFWDVDKGKYTPEDYDDLLKDVQRLYNRLPDEARYERLRQLMNAAYLRLSTEVGPVRQSGVEFMRQMRLWAEGKTSHLDSDFKQYVLDLGGDERADRRWLAQALREEKSRLSLNLPVPKSNGGPLLACRCKRRTPIDTEFPRERFPPVPAGAIAGLPDGGRKLETGAGQGPTASTPTPQTGPNAIPQTRQEAVDWVLSNIPLWRPFTLPSGYPDELREKYTRQDLDQYRRWMEATVRTLMDDLGMPAAAAAVLAYKAAAEYNNTHRGRAHFFGKVSVQSIREFFDEQDAHYRQALSNTLAEWAGMASGEGFEQWLERVQNSPMDGRRFLFPPAPSQAWKPDTKDQSNPTSPYAEQTRNMAIVTLEALKWACGHGAPDMNHALFAFQTNLDMSKTPPVEYGDVKKPAGAPESVPEPAPKPQPFQTPLEQVLRGGHYSYSFKKSGTLERTVFDAISANWFQSKAEQDSAFESLLKLEFNDPRRVAFNQLVKGALVQDPGETAHAPDLDDAKIQSKKETTTYVETSRGRTREKKATEYSNLLLPKEAARVFDLIYNDRPEDRHAVNNAFKITEELSHMDSYTRYYYYSAREGILANVIQKTDETHPDLAPDDRIGLANALRSTLIDTYHLQYMPKLAESKAIEEMDDFAKTGWCHNKFTGNQNPTIDCDGLANLITDAMNRKGVPAWQVTMGSADGQLHDGVVFFDKQSGQYVYYEPTLGETVAACPVPGGPEPPESVPFSPNGKVYSLQEMAGMFPVLYGIGAENVSAAIAYTDVQGHLAQDDETKTNSLNLKALLFTPADARTNQAVADYYYKQALNAERRGDDGGAAKLYALALKHYQRAEDPLNLEAVEKSIQVKEKQGLKAPAKKVKQFEDRQNRLFENAFANAENR